MPPTIELSGVSIVGAGSFNPAIFQPRWLAAKELVPDGLAEHAETQLVVTPQLTAFTSDWLSLQVTDEQAVFSTVHEGREVDLRDFARGVLEVLPETPVDALGINADAHFKVESEDAWHALGDQWLPKTFWEPLFEGDQWKRRPDGHAVGLRTLTVETWREDLRGWVRVEVAPSVRVRPTGAYFGVNAHFQLSTEAGRGTGHEAARTIEEEWDTTRELEVELLGSSSKPHA